jgi:sarcosine oxidase subunit alpha
VLDADRYDKCYAHCDVLVVGGGPSGLAAAHAAATAGARVILVDDQRELGGSLLSCRAEIDGKPALQWVEKIEAELRKLPDVTILSRSTAFGYQDHNLVTVTQRLTEHLPVSMRKGTRELLWKVRAKRVILATGAHERPIVFGNNDLPGVMLAGAVSTYVHRYGVLPGRNVVVFTNNDRAYQTALDLKACGAKVTVVDSRASSNGALPAAAKRQGVTVMSGAVVTAHRANGAYRRSTSRRIRTGRRAASCSRWGATWSRCRAASARCCTCSRSRAARPAGTTRRRASCRARAARGERGAAAGEFGLARALRLAVDAGAEAAKAAGFVAAQRAVAPQAAELVEGALQPLWLVGSREAAARGPKQFVDFQNDVAAADILLAAREGFESVEHVKRYTAMGFGTDQGKLGNINGMAILAQALGKTIPETGTTTFRPNYTPVSFGTFAGRETGDFLDPMRKTCVHEWHVEHGAMFEDVGNWKRPWYFPKKGEDLHAAVQRECLAVRNSVGILDASTLGKIDIQGPDAAKLLNWMYTNPWSKLEVGKCRYGLMLDENGMVFDDGVTVRLADQHFMMTTTTGGAARVLTWLERWLQTEWPDMKVRLASVTDHWATFAVVGPKSRKVVQKVCQDIDFGNDAFPFMSYRNGTVAGVKARVMRISFSGELAYEVNVPANAGARCGKR